MTDPHEYEAKVWRENGTYAAKLLRNGVAWNYKTHFESRDEALGWARIEADKDRQNVEAEAKAERVPV